MILLFHVPLSEVTWWHSVGRWAGLEDLRQLHSRVWHPSRRGWRAELSWN